MHRGNNARPSAQRISSTTSCCGCACHSEAETIAGPRHELADAEREATGHSMSDRAAARSFKCIIRGLLLLLWVYMIDFVRRTFIRHGHNLIVGMFFPHLIIVACVISFCLCIASELLDECIPTQFSY
ncbi:hypothetical protein PVAP13_8KG094900 [Panicum virgatum]|uniref:Uncharacterized protein n=1 Tax=Panicum virgatum TaxID=38727 RepID=A0A8T0PRH8_PANVG|nr:hypothetical protein PVAP13_8KG094900 [Panicum virgatum]